MNHTNVLILSIFLGFSILLMVITYFFYKRLKNNVENFVENNKNRAILRLFADKAKINGKKLREFDCHIGEGLETLVALEPGKYIISGKYTATDISIVGNQTYEMPKPVEIEVELEKGHIHILDLYFEKPYELVIETGSRLVSAIQLEISGTFAKHKEAYLICTKMTCREYQHILSQRTI